MTERERAREREREREREMCVGDNVFSRSVIIPQGNVMPINQYGHIGMRSYFCYVCCKYDHGAAIPQLTEWEHAVLSEVSKGELFFSLQCLLLKHRQT